MKKIVFISFPVAGHVNPQYSLCEELSKRDIALIYYTAEKYVQKYEGIKNIEIHTYPKEFMDYYDELAKDITLHKKMMGLMYVFNTFTEKIFPFIIEDLDKVKPDLIISDSLAVWGKAAARYLKVDYALFFSSFMGDSIIMKKTPSFTLNLMKSVVCDLNYVIEFQRIKKRIEKKYGKITDSMPRIMDHQGVFTMVSTSRKFHPGGELYPENVHFVKPYIFNDNQIEQKKDTIFISVGTISFSHTFWDICIEATESFNYRVVISFGNNKNNSIQTKEIRENVEVYSNLNLDVYRKELERSEIFITHGGFNSITDGIIAESKLLVCPVTAEQVSNGKVLEAYGCGKLLSDKKITAKKLETAIRELLEDKKMRKNLITYKESFKNEKTYKEVVDALGKEYNVF